MTPGRWPRFLVACAMWTALVTPVGAAEVDSFTQRYENLKDVSDALDAHTNQLLDRAIDDANHYYASAADPAVTDSGGGCDPQHVYSSVRALLGRRFVGQMEVYVHHNDDIDKRRLTRNESIYRDFRFYESPSLTAIRRIGAIMRLGDNIIGSDKFGHFFAEGYSYFKRAYLHEGGVSSAFRFGERSERVLYGGLTTGVYSYADLVANFNGMRFYAHLLDEFPDPLGENLGPYVQCRDNKWVRARNFSWLDYTDAGWDEGINCNNFKSASLVERVTRRLDELQVRVGRPMHCPVTRRFDRALREKYGPYFTHLINLDGIAEFAHSGVR